MASDKNVLAYYYYYWFMRSFNEHHKAMDRMLIMIISYHFMQCMSWYALAWHILPLIILFLGDSSVSIYVVISYLVRPFLLLLLEIFTS